MLIVRILFAFSGACFVFLLIRYLVHRRIAPNNQLRHRLDTIRMMHTPRQQTVNIQQKEEGGIRRQLKDIPFVERVVKPAKKYFSNLANNLTPQEWREWFQHKIVLAGKTQEIKPGTLFVAMVVCGFACFGLVWIYAARNNVDAMKMMALLFLGFFVGFAIPLAVLHSMIKKRQEEIMRQLPEVLDLLCVSVQAGLSFDAALHKITARMKGPLIDEFRHFQDDVRMGMIRRNAMKHLAERCELQDVSLFITALIQAEKLGSSMGKTLKAQADNIRERRRQFIRAEAMRAPIKILFPLVLFIFPAIFVVTLVPALLSLMKSL